MSGALTGKRVAVTRAREQADEMAAKLRALGAEPVLWPLIAFAPPEDDAPLQTAIGQLRRFDWIVFSSANGVRAFCERLDRLPSKRPRVAAVGPQTAHALEALGWTVTAVPAEFLGTKIAEAIGDVRGQSILVIRPDIAPPDLAESLRTRGAIVHDVVAYRTLSAGDDTALDLNAVDAITLASASAASELARRLAGHTVPARICIACIGPSTAKAARAAGLPVTCVAATHTLDGLVAALAAHYTDEVPV